MKLILTLLAAKGNVFLLEHLYIDPKYRGSGIGFYVLSILEQLLSHICRFDIGCILTKPIPLDQSEKGLIAEKDQKKYAKYKEDLKQLLKQAGFKQRLWVTICISKRNKQRRMRVAKAMSQ